jgi:hypothetical protein
MGPGSRGACHRARIRATRWLGPDDGILYYLMNPWTPRVKKLHPTNPCIGLTGALSGNTRSVRTRSASPR